MATATKRKPKAKVRSVELREDYRSGFSGKVDHEESIIRSVKIVGLESRNRARVLGLDQKEFGRALDQPYGYSRRALESAIPLYEGATVRIDHPPTKRESNGARVIVDSSRPTLSMAGVLSGVRFQEDGLYGDMELVKAHEGTARILEIAERWPNKIALSHHAFGDPKIISGRVVIDHINSVESVDIIGDQPGTTNGLFESHSGETTVAKTIREIVESLDKKHVARRLLEMEGEDFGGADMAELPVEVPADADTDMEVANALRAAVMAIMDNAELDSAAKLEKIGAIFAIKDEVEGVAPAEEVPAETVESKMKTKHADPKVRELLETVAELKRDRDAANAERDALQAREHARTLLESADRKADEVRLDSLVALSTDAKRKALIETWGKDKDDPAVPRPRRSAPLLESADEKPLSGESFIKAVKTTPRRY